ncbi:MAG: D,D-dipeptide ABC transporter permease, partial [Rhodospirillales bacterium]|nr:D,D-dipeptide ABC transporter permease [Rhodospirillales bacterium]
MTDITAGTAERSRWETFLHALRFLLAVLRARPLFALGYFIVLLVFILAIFAPLIAPYEPEVANPVDFLQGPSWRHLFGTDATGMDIFSRIVYA